MQQFVATMNQEHVDFIIHLGDMKDEDVTQNEGATLSFLKKIERVFQQFKGPTYHCVGNHDVDSITKAQFSAAIDNTGIKPTCSYYSFDLKGIHFVVLDANYHQSGKDHFFKEGADWQDPNIPQKELHWLERDLSETSFPSLLFSHHPLFEYYKGTHGVHHVTNYREVQEILQASEKVFAVLQGHVHEETARYINGIHYITQQGMVEGEGLANNSYALIELDEKELSIKGFGRSSDHKLEINL